MPRKNEYDMTYPNKLREMGIELLEDFSGSKKHHEMKCIICSHKWSATPISKLQNFKKYGKGGCPICSKKEQEISLEKVRQKLISDIKERGFEILSEFDGKRTIDNIRYKIKIKNTDCGHEFETLPGNLISRNVICPICNTQRKREAFQNWNNERQEKYLETATEWQKYKSKVFSLTRISYRENKRFINPDNLKQGRAGVLNAYHLDHIVPIRYCFDNNIPAEICSHPQNLQMLHWNDNIGSRDHLKDKLPPVFHSFVKVDDIYSIFVNDIKDAFPFDILFFSDVLHPYPLTAYFPDKQVGIVFCPIEEYKEQNTKNRHFNKNIFKEGNKKGIRVIQIFEDEWFFSKDLWLMKLRHILGINTSSKIYARKCSIQEITPELKNKFLDKNHIQGKDNSNISLGAFYNDELVAVMTFAKPRILMRKKIKNDNDYELCRFATNINYTIPGIASRLLKYFIRNYQYDEIYSYADLRHSNGNLYYQLGFELEETNALDYYYIIDGVRKHRWGYRKDVLKTLFSNYDPELTEYKNMLNNGYDRVWGCGTMKFVICQN